MTATEANARDRLVDELKSAYRRAAGKWKVELPPSDAQIEQLVSCFPMHEAFPTEDDELLSQVASLGEKSIQSLDKLARHARAMNDAFRELPDPAKIAIKHALVRFGGFDNAQLSLAMNEVVSCIDGLKRRKKGKGQPKMSPVAVRIAAHIIRDFEQLTGRNADQDLSKDGRAGPLVLVADVFKILGIKTSARRAVDRAVEHTGAHAKPVQDNSSLTGE